MFNLVKLYFSEIDLDAITKAVGQAEKSSSAEIVVRIASRSYGWIAERLVFGGLLALAGFFFSLFLTRSNNWGLVYDFQQATLWTIVGFATGFLLTMFLFQTTGRFERVVWNRARREFRALRMTTGQTRVLILLSLMERRAAIVVDEAVAAVIDAEYWKTPLAPIVDGMKSGDHAEGVIKAVTTISSELMEKLPNGPDDVDELPNRPEIL